MANIPSCRFDITGASGSQGLLGPKDSWRAYVLERGGNASQDSTGTLITFDSAAIASRFAVSDWIQAGLLTANIRQVGSVGGNSINVSGAALTVTENMRIFICGVTEPTLTGNSATYHPSTTIRQRGDDSADTYTNSMVTTNSDGLVQFYAAPQMYDVIVQDGNQSNQGYIADLEVGTVEGISVVDTAIFGQTVTFIQGVSVNGNLTVGGTVTIYGNLAQTRYADAFSGADWGVKVSAAIDALPSGGGTVDARGLIGAQAIGSTLTISKNNVTVLVGQCAVAMSAGIVVGATFNSHFTGLGNSASSFVRAGGYGGVLIEYTAAVQGVEIDRLTFDNNNTALNCINMANGVADVWVHHNRFPNQGSGEAFQSGTGASLNKRITIEHNYIESSASTQNIRAIDLSDFGDDCRALNNTIIKTGAISCNQGSAGVDAQSRIEVSGNHFEGVDSSNILVRPVSGGTLSVTDVVITNNTFENAGLTLGKGFIVVGENAGAAAPPVFRRCVIANNIGRGFGDSSGGGVGIGVDGDTNPVDGTEVLVHNNIIDARQKDGTQQNSSYGMFIRGNARNMRISGNIIRNTGRSGITLQDTSFCMVDSNIIELPCQYASAANPPSTQMGGIQVHSGNTQLSLFRNKILNPGISGASSYGIYVRDNGTNNTIICSGNECVDDRGAAVAAMIQGVLIGASPLNVYFSLQRSSGGLTADFGQSITAVGNAIRPFADTWRIDPSADLMLTSTPTIVSGFDGQRVKLLNVDGGTYTVAIQDQGTLASSNLRLTGVSVTISPRCSVDLQYDATVGDWVQISNLVSVI